MSKITIFYFTFRLEKIKNNTDFVCNKKSCQKKKNFNVKMRC